MKNYPNSVGDLLPDRISYAELVYRRQLSRPPRDIPVSVLHYTYQESEHLHQALERYVRLFPVPIQKRWSKYNNQLQRRSSIISKLLAYAGVYGTNRPANPVDLPMHYNPAGKPILIGDINLDFSVSHSHRLIGCALHHNGHVGLDIQWKGDLADKFEQYNAMIKGHLGVQDFSLADWSKLEALVKFFGTGLMDAKAAWAYGLKNPDLYRSYQAFSDHYCSLVVKPVQRIEFTELSNNDLIDSALQQISTLKEHYHAIYEN